MSKIIAKESFRIPGTETVIEKGQTFEVMEGFQEGVFSNIKDTFSSMSNFTKTNLVLDLFNVWALDLHDAHGETRRTEINLLLKHSKELRRDLSTSGLDMLS